MADQKNLMEPFGDEIESSNIDIDEKLLVDLRLLKIVSVIREGTHSIVYEGLYKNYPVAVKKIVYQKLSKVSRVRAPTFKREVAMLSTVQHENIVKFLGAAVEPSMIIITELMKGGSLQSFLWKMRPNRLSLEDSLSFALGISKAMEYLHSKDILHRDIKPDNILLSEDHKTVKLADFGLARVEDNEMTTEAGTYRWMAPEMIGIPDATVTRAYDRKVDVYSFSMVLWELITNITPFKDRKDSKLAAYAAFMKIRPTLDELPEDIAPFIEACWAVDPIKRPHFEEITVFLSNYLEKIGKTKSRPLNELLMIEKPGNGLTGEKPEDDIEDGRASNDKKPCCGFLKKCFK